MFSVPVGEIMCQDILELFLLVIKIELAASESHNNSLFPFCASFTNTKGREQTLPTVQLCSLLFLSVYAPISGVNGEGRKKSRGKEWFRLSEVNYNAGSSDVLLQLTDFTNKDHRRSHKLVYKPCSTVRVMFFTWSHVQKIYPQSRNNAVYFHITLTFSIY